MALDRKGGYLYHGDLRSDFPEGVYLMRSGDPEESKYGTNVPVQIDGQGTKTFKLKAENASVLAHLEALDVNTWHFVKAVGGKETACLDITDEAGNPVAAPEVSRPSPPGRSAPASAGSRPSAPTAVQTTSDVTSIEAVVREAMVVAANIREEVEQGIGRELDEHDRTIATTILIQFFQNNGRLPIREP